MQIFDLIMVSVQNMMKKKTMIMLLMSQLLLIFNQVIQVAHGSTTAASSKSDAANLKLQQKYSLTRKNDDDQKGLATTNNNNDTSGGGGVDEILRDTFQLLDSLDQKLAQVNNRTKSNGDESLLLSSSSSPSSFMREMRLLGYDDELDSVQPTTDDRAKVSGGGSSSQAASHRLEDDELTQLAQGFSSERRLSASSGGGEPLITSASNNNEQHIAFNLPASPNAPKSSSSTSGSSLSSESGSGSVSGPAPPPQPPTLIGANSRAAKRARQLNQDDDLRMLASGSAGGSNSLGKSFDNDFTDKHIKFTLDMMRAIFSSQSYTAKSNSIDSFLISPVSIQLVLMMMHLGARGHTKRELSNTLHFLSSSPSSSLSSSASNHSSPVQQQQHQEFTLGLLTNQNGANLSGNNSLVKNAKLTRRHQQQHQQQQHLNSKQAAQNQRQQQQQQAQGNSQTQAQNNNNNNNNNSGLNNAQALNNNVHEQFGAAMRQLLKDSSVVRSLTSANQIFLQKDLPLSPQYEWAVKHYYGADLKQVDFQNQFHSDQHNQHQQQSRLSAGNSTSGGNSTQHSSSAAGVSIQQTINEWVERQTRGKISNFLSAPVPTTTLLMALNVLFYKGDWQYKFDPADTDPDAWFTKSDGKTVRVPMMVNKLPLAHAHDPIMKTSVIELPYKAQRLGLFILLPDEVNGIFDTMQMLNSTSFANLISMMRKSAPNSGAPSSSGGSPSPSDSNGGGGGGGGINVRIPKFSIESSPRLSQILSQQLGLKSLFSPDVADLSGMFASNNLLAQKRPASNQSSSSLESGASSSSSSSPAPLQVGLDELLHKAVLQVHEQGSVAAAASATIVERVGLFNGQYFEADHPFLLFLMDKQTGLVLFSGVFAGPTNPEATSYKSSQQQQQQSPLTSVAATNLTTTTVHGSDGSHSNRYPKASATTTTTTTSTTS